MTTYRLFDGASGRPGVGSSGTQPPASPTAFAGNFLAGTMFSVTGQMMWLQGYWWWVPPGGDTGAQKFALWNITSTTTQSLVSGSVVTSGTLTAGAMNFVPLTPNIQIAPGTLYNCTTGWVSVNGFPDSQNQFGATQPYASGVVNGPLTGWSDLGASNTFPAASANQAHAQGLFSSTLGSDPSVNMANGGSNSSNFWVDIQVSDTAPATYTGSYRLYPNMGDLGNFSLDTATNFTLGREFSLAKSCTLNKYWFYSPATVTQLPTACGIFKVSDQSLVTSNSSPSWSGAAASGWVSAGAGASVVLSPGVSYRLGILNGAGTPAIWNAAVASYWSTGFGGSGLTAGPVTFPNSASAHTPGQDSFHTGAALTYPDTNVGPFNYGLDLEVTPVPPAAVVAGGGGSSMLKRAIMWADL